MFACFLLRDEDAIGQLTPNQQKFIYDLDQELHSNIDREIMQVFFIFFVVSILLTYIFCLY